MVMTGLEAATSGQVLVAGHDFTALSEDRLAEVRGQSIGIVFQSFHLIPTMTAIENVALPLEFLNRRDAFERAEEALAEVGLSGRHHHMPGQLSGVSSSVSRWRVPLRPRRRFFSRTSQRVISMAKRASRSWT